MKLKNILSVVSSILTAITLASVIVMFFFMPSISKAYLDLVNTFTQERYLGVLLLGRSALVVAALALGALLLLLYNVKNENVFSSLTQNVMTVLACCCFAELIVFSLLARYFLLSFVIAFAALLLGILLLVLRCVFAQAIEIKTENDFTV